MEIAPECNFYIRCGHKLIFTLIGLLSPSPITTNPIVPILKICLVLVKTQNHHSFLLSCGIVIQLVNLTQGVGANSGYTKRKALAAQSNQIDMITC